MKPTKIMPYIVLIDSGKNQVTYAFRTEKQARRFFKDVQVGTNFKVGLYISIEKAKRG